MTNQPTTPASDDPRLSEVTRICLTYGGTQPSALRIRGESIRTRDLPELLALINKLAVQ
ncbi:hypothetical protein ACQEU3_47000 [Spirillospora sp. CA-253888]